MLEDRQHFQENDETDDDETDHDVHVLYCPAICRSDSTNLAALASHDQANRVERVF